MLCYPDSGSWLADHFMTALLTCKFREQRSKNNNVITLYTAVVLIILRSLLMQTFPTLFAIERDELILELHVLVMEKTIYNLACSWLWWSHHLGNFRTLFRIYWVRRSVLLHLQLCKNLFPQLSEYLMAFYCHLCRDSWCIVEVHCRD